ncbi:MAG: 50S ribosomal protein L21 [Lachnospiraceae bacterium]|nr:50S ribosomal protein L21 [Lachnospiraceae bacterium]
MYAIIESGGKQLKVSEGDIVKVEKLVAEKGDSITFDDVLAVSDNGKLSVADDVKSAKVTATVLEQGKEKKVIVFRYKPKSGYRKKNGHRQPFTRVKIEKISL